MFQTFPRLRSQVPEGSGMVSSHGKVRGTDVLRKKCAEVVLAVGDSQRFQQQKSCQSLFPNAAPTKGRSFAKTRVSGNSKIANPEVSKSRKCLPKQIPGALGPGSLLGF